MLNDEQKLDKIINLIPESWVDDLVNVELYNKHLSPDSLVRFRRFMDEKDKISSQFSNDNLRESFLVLIESANKLSEQLSLFFRKNPEDIHYTLLPDHEYNSDKEKRKFWLEKYNKIKNLAVNFKTAYDNLLKTWDLISNKQIKKGADHLVFDSLNRVIRYENETLKFQSGTNLKFELFKKLWEERQAKNKVGKPFPSSALARNIETTEAELRKKIKELRTDLRRKGFPAKIETKRGVQLVVG